MLAISHVFSPPFFAHNDDETGGSSALELALEAQKAGTETGDIGTTSLVPTQDAVAALPPANTNVANPLAPVVPSTPITPTPVANTLKVCPFFCFLIAQTSPDMVPQICSYR